MEHLNRCQHIHLRRRATWQVPPRIALAEVSVLGKFRREAAVLAAYLSQFENTDSDYAQHSPYVGITGESRARTHADYQQACRWIAATECTDGDIVALTRMRRRYGFPTEP